MTVSWELGLKWRESRWKKWMAELPLEVDGRPLGCEKYWTALADLTRMDCTYFIFCFETNNPIPESWGAWRSRSANRQLGERGEHPQLGSGAPEVRNVCKVFHRHRSRSATSRDKMTDATVRRCNSHFINECKDSRLSGNTYRNMYGRTYRKYMEVSGPTGTFSIIVTSVCGRILIIYYPCHLWCSKNMSTILTTTVITLAPYLATKQNQQWSRHWSSRPVVLKPV